MVVTERRLDREAMVERQLEQRGIRNPRVLAAFRDVPREAFVEPGLEEFAYLDGALPIGEGQTISQPYIVALAVEALDVKPTDRVLEVGAGSGYAAAILSRLAARVYAIERHASLARQAEERLRRLGYDNVEVRTGDGRKGWPEAAPFDAILVSAGGEVLPLPLLEQLAPGGRLVMPVGNAREQNLLKVTKRPDGRYEVEDLGPVRFVPLVGGAEGEGRTDGGPRRERSPADRQPGAGATAVAAPVALAQLVARALEPFPSIEDADLGPVVERIGDATLVLIGEASHGTSEFYRMRARITRELIRRGRIRFVALEADWPAAARLDRYVRYEDPRGKPTSDAFARFPTWMWQNEEVLEFVDWLRAWNHPRDPADRVAIHGMDLYSLDESAAQVIEYLERIDPDLAALARRRYACFTPFEADPAMYGYAAATEAYRKCEDEVVAMLRELLDRRLELEAREGDRYFDAVQNARVVVDAEGYYRAMYRGSAESWNLRDRHMFDTVGAVLEAHGRGAAGAIWAHNSHVGDASATEMAARGELNIGQLAQERFGDNAYRIGFGTHTGTVAAAHDWDGEVTVMQVRPSRPDTYERVYHQSGVPAGFGSLREPRVEGVRDELLDPRLERAIGVIYRPEAELLSHYFQAILPLQFDEYTWFDETRAVTPLGHARRVALGPGHPFAPVDV